MSGDKRVFLRSYIPGTDVEVVCTGSPTVSDVEILREMVNGHLGLTLVALRRTTPKPPEVPKWIPAEWRPR